MQDFLHQAASWRWLPNCLDNLYQLGSDDHNGKNSRVEIALKMYMPFQRYIGHMFDRFQTIGTFQVDMASVWLYLRRGNSALSDNRDSPCLMSFLLVLSKYQLDMHYLQGYYRQIRQDTNDQRDRHGRDSMYQLDSICQHRT